METSCSIIRTSNKLMSIYRDENGNAVQKTYANRVWSLPQPFAKGIDGDLSANISSNENIFVFCQKNDGTVALFHHNGEQWEARPFHKSGPSAVYNLKIYSVIEKSIYILYNLPSKLTSEIRHKIVSQEASGVTWAPFVTVAENVSDSRPPFFVRHFAKNRCAVFYQTGTMESVFGYREFRLPDKWGGFIPLHSTLQSFTDKSAVIADECVHTAFILRGAYSCQLVYVRCSESGLSPALVLFEANRIESVSVVVKGKKVFVIFSAGGYGFFRTASNDFGKTFQRPVRLKTAGNGTIIKADFIAVSTFDPSLSMNDLFTEAENPGIPLFIEDLTDNFYPSQLNYDNTEDENAQNSQEAASKRRASNVSEKDDLSKDNLELLEMKDILEDRKVQLSIFENKLERANQEINDKTRQIIELNSHLSSRNKEIAAVAESYKETIIRLRNSLSDLEAVVAELENRLADKDKAVAELEEQLADREKAVAELEEQLADKDKAVAELGVGLNADADADGLLSVPAVSAKEHEDDSAASSV